MVPKPGEALVTTEKVVTSLEQTFHRLLTVLKEDAKNLLEQMKADVKYTNEHIQALAMIESIKAKHGDISTRNWHGLIAKVEGHLSLDNILVKCNVTTIVTLKIINSSEKQIHTIQGVSEIVIQNSAKTTKIFNGPLVLGPKTSAEFLLKVDYADYGDYVHYLIFEHRSGNLLSVKLVFRVLSDALTGLQPIEPYKRLSKVVYEVKCEEIVRAPDSKLRRSNPASKKDLKNRKPLKMYPLPPFMRDVLNMGFKDAAQLHPGHKEEILKVQRLLKVPNKHNPLTSTNYVDMLNFLLQMEEHQMSRDIHDYDAEDQALKHIFCNQFELEVPGLAEHRPSLIRGDSVYVKESKTSTVKYEGKVIGVQETSVVLCFNKRFVESVYVKDKKFFVSFTYNRYTLKVEHQAVEIVRNHNIASRFFNIQKSLPCIYQNKIPEITWINNDIKNNIEQKQAVINIIQKSAYPSPYIIFGPPGTGKTATLVEAINQIYKRKPADKMLVLAPTNHAADEIAGRLLKTIPGSNLFRYVAISFPYLRVRAELRPFTNYKQGQFYHPPLSSLRNYRIIISSLSNSARLVNAGISPKHFSYVMIDESGHATETETLVGIAGMLSHVQQPYALTGQLVLVGDPKQLDAITHSKQAKEYGFGTSMLERLMNTIPAYQKNNGQYNASLITKLVNNYRSNQNILEIPNKLFYDGDLKTMGDNTVNTAVGWDELPNPKYPLIFHSVVGVDQREKNSPSFFNLQEVTVVLNYLDLLIGTKMKGITIRPEHIGIIAPYRKQVEKIDEACKKTLNKGEKVQIGSVDQFQGSEKMIIIVSTTRSNTEYLKIDHKFHLGFLRNPKRMNVALTRAKALLIVIGNPYILQYDDNWRQFIQYCQENNCTKGTKFVLDDKLTVVKENAPIKDQYLALDTNNNDDQKNPEGTIDFSRGQR